MTDRDRLAADLAANPLTLIPDGVTPLSRKQTYRNDYIGLADRLIALGWTRLDDERLARALEDENADLRMALAAAYGEGHRERARVRCA